VSASSGPKESPERQLWCAVIQRANNAALGYVGAVSGTTERRRASGSAREWFVKNDRNFRLACEAAGFDSERLRQAALQLIERSGATASSVEAASD
jgi:hypothetical protein